MVAARTVRPLSTLLTLRQCFQCKSLKTIKKYDTHPPSSLVFDSEEHSDGWRWISRIILSLLLDTPHNEPMHIQTARTDRFVSSGRGSTGANYGAPSLVATPLSSLMKVPTYGHTLKRSATCVIDDGSSVKHVW